MKEITTCRTMGQFLLRDTSHPLEVVMAGVAEVCGAEAEENSHRAAVPAFILKEVGAMLGAHLVEACMTRQQDSREVILNTGQHSRRETHSLSSYHSSHREEVTHCLAAAPSTSF